MQMYHLVIWIIRKFDYDDDDDDDDDAARDAALQPSLWTYSGR